MTTTTTLGKAFDTSDFKKINKITISIQKYIVLIGSPKTAVPHGS